MEHWRKEVDRGKPNYSGKYLSQWHFIHHKPTLTDPGSNLGLRGERPATNHLRHGMAHFIPYRHTHSSSKQATFSAQCRNANEQHIRYFLRNTEFNYHMTEMTGRRGRRRKQLLDDLKENRKY
jgi:hypothetical protein